MTSWEIYFFLLYFLLGGSVLTARPSGNPQLEKFRLNIIGSGKPPTGLNREVTSIFFLSKIGLAWYIELEKGDQVGGHEVHTLAT